MLERLRQRSISTRPSPHRRDLAAETAETARALADALDRAIELGLHEHAERIARAAARIARHHPRLTDRLARRRLALGDPETAVALIDACASMPSSLRLLRAGCLLRLGRKLDAHLDLHRWTRRPSAPLTARLLLALLEWERGDRGAAIEALRRNLQQLEDSRTLELLVLLHAADDHGDWLAVWSDRLRAAAAWTVVDPDPDMLLLSLGLPRTLESIEPTLAHVETLATELIASEAVIPALVEAQQRRPRFVEIGLLAHAIEIALPDLAQPDVALEQLARLSLLCDDMTAARRWAERARQANPMSASLALLVHELAQNTAADGGSIRSAGDVLARIGLSGAPTSPTGHGKGQAA
ncbi:MAG: hypothetical protein ACYTGG_02165 [Planctomycetota bacterium]|jgi:hypothetical protein